MKGIKYYPGDKVMVVDHYKSGLLESREGTIVTLVKRPRRLSCQKGYYYILSHPNSSPDNVVQIRDVSIKMRVL